MTEPDNGFPKRSLRDWLRRVFGSRRPPITRPPTDRSRDTVRVQVDVIRRAYDGQVGVATETGDDADATFLYRPDHLLVRRDQREELDSFLSERGDDFDGVGEVVEEPIEGLDLYRLPSRRDGGDAVLRTLDDLERAGRSGLATPDHLLYVVASVGKLCPATEPALPPEGGPVPRPSKDPTAGEGVRISVVDSGWYADAAADADTPWLASGVQGDLEQVDPAAIHPYAGHGTFVAGVIRCLAPASTVEVEGVLTNGGAVFESRIAAELNEAVRDRPDLISISAGTHTYKNRPLRSFEALAAAYGLAESDEGPLIVAAAGNDGNDEEFWPAAFDWVVSVGAVERDGARCDFSNHGPWVDVYAHGRDLVNAFPTGTYTTYEPTTPDGEVRQFTTGLAQWSGTSFATPIVTGAIAAYMSQHGVSARAARDALVAAAPSVPDPTGASMKTLGPPFV